MSIVTTLLGKLTFIGAISSRIVSIQSRLKLQGVYAATPRLRLGRQWFSPSTAKDYNAQQYAKKVYAESQARFPIAR